MGWVFFFSPLPLIKNSKRRSQKGERKIIFYRLKSSQRLIGMASDKLGLNWIQAGAKVTSAAAGTKVSGAPWDPPAGGKKKNQNKMQYPAGEKKIKIINPPPKKPQHKNTHTQKKKKRQEKRKARVQWDKADGGPWLRSDGQRWIYPCEPPTPQPLTRGEFCIGPRTQREEAANPKRKGWGSLPPTTTKLRENPTQALVEYKFLS